MAAIYDRIVMGARRVDPDDLAMLVHVVDTGSVTRAAEGLFMSQPAVIHRLRRLERTVGPSWWSAGDGGSD